VLAAKANQEGPGLNTFGALRLIPLVEPGYDHIRLHPSVRLTRSLVFLPGRNVSSVLTSTVDTGRLRWAGLGIYLLYSNGRSTGPSCQWGSSNSHAIFVAMMTSKKNGTKTRGS
jgi:hypothetical protein